MAPRLRPRYVARLAVRIIQDPTPEAEIGIMYPDVEILERPHAPQSMQPHRLEKGTPLPEAISTVIPSLAIPLLDFEVRLISVEVRDSANNQLVVSPKETGKGAISEKKV